MTNNEQNEDNENNKSRNNYLKFSAVGFQMIVIIGLFTFAGYKIDESARHTVKWVTATLSLTGVFISLYVVIRSLKE
jgi:ATP synthase protein I